MPLEPLDSSPHLHQNTDSTQNGADEVLHINMSEKTPLNDPNCGHSNVRKDPTEELGEAFMCADCHIGWIVA